MSLSGESIIKAILGEPSVEEQIAALAAKVDQVLHHRTPTLDEARGACNEAGVHAARKALRDSLERIEAAQTAKRAADEELRIAAENETDALTDAEWELDIHFETEGNKTYLMLSDGTRKAMTADERKAWKASKAKQSPTVVGSVNRRRAAEQQVAETRHMLELADKYHQVCRADLEAACAVLATIRLALSDGAAR